MRTENDLASRVQALEDRITRMSRDYDDTMYNIGSENLSSELSQRLNGLTLKLVTKSKGPTDSEIHGHSYAVDMEKPVKAVVFATVYDRDRSAYCTVTNITVSSNTATITINEIVGAHSTVTVHALVTS